MLQILINNKLVTQTSSANLNNDFTIHVGQTYRMALSSWPRSITLEVMEGAGLRQTLLATVFLPVPGRTSVCKELYDDIEFSSNQVSK